VSGACRTSDRFVHQGAAEVVHPGVEANPCAFAAHFYPGNLDILDIGMQHQTSDRVHQQCLPESWAATGLAFKINRGFHMHKGQRHKLGEAAGFFLQIPHPDQVPRPVVQSFAMAEHDGGRAPETGLVHFFHHLQPLSSTQLVGTQHGPRLVVENFRGGTRQGAQPLVFQLFEELCHGQIERCGTLPDFQG